MEIFPWTISWYVLKIVVEMNRTDRFLAPC
jgi:hypothetical protein